MALRVRTFIDANELKNYLENNEMGPEDIMFLDINDSDHMVILFDDADEILKYHAGVSGTVTLNDGDRIQTIWCVGATGTTIEIFGGDAIPIPEGVPFSFELGGKMKGDGAKTVVFTNSSMYLLTYIARG
jgi:hypothetical protein